MHDDIDALVKKMRELGITKYESGDLKVELGPAPTPGAPPVDERQQMIAEKEHEKREAIRRHAVLFGSSSSKPRIVWKAANK